MSRAASATGPQETWIFGYGSLVWRPAFRHLLRRPAWVAGWRRRFWQGSTDHRGVPGAPGRVATLVRESAQPTLACWGMAYLVASPDLDEVLAGLDHREKGGYDRIDVEMQFRGRASMRDGASDRASRVDAEPVIGLMYVATPSNPNYLGPAPLDVIARQVLSAHGPSGPNPEYVSRLAEALIEISPELVPGTEDALALGLLMPSAGRQAGEEEVA